MNKVKRCRKCDTEMYRDNQGKWFCPDCILEAIEPDFLDETLDHPGELKTPYVIGPPTQQISIRLPLGDLALARKLARRKGIPKYQTYIKTLLHKSLIKEAAGER